MEKKKWKSELLVKKDDLDANSSGNISCQFTTAIGDEPHLKSSTKLLIRREYRE